MCDIVSVDYKNLDNSKEIIIKAMKQTGFFRIQFDQINNIGEELTLSNINFSQLYDASYNFFHLPYEVKQKMAKNETDNIYYGYFPSSLNKKEGLDIPNKLLDPNSHILANQICFPIEYDNKYIECINNYYDFVHTLSIKILNILAGEHDIAKLFDNINNLSDLRLNYYPKHDVMDEPAEIISSDVKLACETHVDNVILTVLFQDSQGGLQILNPMDNSWMDVKCIDNSLIINTGTLLGMATNNEYTPVNHRVLFNLEERLSIPYFLCPSPDFVIRSAINTMTYHDFLKITLSERKEYSNVVKLLK